MADSSHDDVKNACSRRLNSLSLQQALNFARGNFRKKDVQGGKALWHYSLKMQISS